MSFFNQIIYSSSNEDSASEMAALQLTNDDVVVCISGSGVRTLDLLTASPMKIYSIDFNPAQNALLELKMAAYRGLEYADFCAFVGLNPSDTRLATFEKLASFLTPEAADFWKKHPHFITKGILFVGKWEQFLGGLRKLAFFRKKQIHDLFATPDLEAQKTYWISHWDTPIWRAYLRFITNGFLWKYIVREPGAKFIAPDLDTYAYMKSKLDFFAHTFLFRTNHYAQLLFRGFYDQNCVLPHSLRPENFERIKQNLHKIEIHTCSLSDFLETKPVAISAFSLSDFSSYTSPEQYRATWESVLQSAAPSARFCERQFLVKRHPEYFFNAIKRNKELEARLTASDETAIYTFCAGIIFT